MTDGFPGDDVRRSVHAATRRRVEALWYAAEAGDVAQVETILDEGYHDASGGNYWQTDIDPRGWRRTPLHAAALGGHVALARYLLDQGAAVDPRTKYEDTPLHFAAQVGNAELVQVLLDRGADPVARNDDGDTPLDLARKHGHAAVAALCEAAISRRR